LLRGGQYALRDPGENGFWDYPGFERAAAKAEEAMPASVFARGVLVAKCGPAVVALILLFNALV
jgi:hypothetical protein